MSHYWLAIGKRIEAEYLGVKYSVIQKPVSKEPSFFRTSGERLAFHGRDVPYCLSKNQT